MLARIAHELYWIGRQLSRAEHTARMLDGVFHADVQGRRRTSAACGCPGTGCSPIMGGERPEAPATRDAVVQRLTLDREHPASVASCVTQAREGARTVRDVFSAEMWEAINTFHLGLLRRDNSAALRTGPVLGLRLRQGALRPVLGRDGPDDAARRGARVPRGGRADRGRRHDAADAARRPARRRRAETHAPTARRSRCCRPSAASRRSAARCPRRRTPAPSAASCSTSAPTRTPSPRRSTSLHEALTEADASSRNSAPVLRLGRLQADLDFRSRALDGDGGASWRSSSTSSAELAQVDADIAQRYFGGASPPAPRLATP